MASNSPPPQSRNEDEQIQQPEHFPDRPLEHPNTTQMLSERQSLPPSVIGSDDADKRLEMRVNVRPKLNRWRQASIFSEPKLLIYTDGSGQFVICNETLNQISAITQKLVIVGIAGPYRCGKSFLMNRLAGKSKGFFVGNTTDAATKGIWAMCKIHPEQEETVLLLLDTEGLGDIKKGNKNHDNKILTLITLLSNVLVFNMMGRFDEDSISKLSFATQISKCVKFGNGPEKRHYLPIVMPELILCLRDFFLDFGHDINSPDDYFEDCLNYVKGEDEYNAPRQSLKTTFQIRHCFTFPRPADEETMKRLENVGEEKLSKSFLQTANQFSQHIFQCEPKQMFSSDLSVHANIDGPIFESLLEYYVDCTKKGIIPDIESAFFTAAQKENEKIMKESIDKFKTMINGIRLPVDSLKDVKDKVQTAIMKSGQMFRERVKMDKNNKQDEKLQSDLQKIWYDMQMENSKLLQEQFVENLMKKYSGSFKETSSSFAKENGYYEYKRELNQMKMDFEKDVKQSLQSEFTLAWSEFMDKIREDEIRVLETDSKVTKEEKERQIKEIKDDHEKAMKEQERKSELLDDEVKRMSEVQTDRDKKHEQQLIEIRNELKKFKGLGVWKRVKFLFKGTVDE